MSTCREDRASLRKATGWVGGERGAKASSHSVCLVDTIEALTAGDAWVGEAANSTHTFVKFQNRLTT